MLTLVKTISCLLIQPNPDSALNSTAGHLLQEDYSAFAEQAALMTSIHARIPPELATTVQATKQRGDDCSVPLKSKSADLQRRANRKTASASSVTMKRPAHLALSHIDSTLRSTSAPMPHHQSLQEGDESDIENDENAENDPSLSPTPVTIPNTSPRRPALEKRPLSDLPTPTEPDQHEEEGGLSPSERI